MPREKPFSFNALPDMLRDQQLQARQVERTAASGRSVDAGSTFTSRFLPGSTGDASMRIVRIDNLVHGWFEVELGSDFSFSGGGPFAVEWAIILPVTPSIGWRWIGDWVAANNLATSSGQRCEGFLEYVGLSTCALRYVTTPPASAFSNVDSTHPWTWTSGMMIWGSFTYEASDLYAP